MRLKCLAVAGMLSVGCGGDEAGCPLPVGAWKLVYAERVDGECRVGRFEVIAAYDGTVASLERNPDGCTGGRRFIEDSCELVIDVTCVTEDGAGRRTGTVRTVGELEFASDTHAEGLVQLTIGQVDGSSCVSMFAITGKPQ